MTIITGTGIELYRWKAVQKTLQLAKLGLTGRRGVIPALKRELGLKPGCKFEVLEAAVEAKIKEAEANFVPGDIR